MPTNTTKVVNKKVKKQKQKQKQHQTVVVNVNTRGPATRRRASKPRGRSGGGGGGGGFSHPVYLNSPDFPQQFQYQNQPMMPQRALDNTQTGQTTPNIPTTQLQTATADVKPLVGVVRATTPIPKPPLQTNDEVNIPLIKKIPSRSGGISIDELKSVLSSPSKGLKSIGSNISQPTLFNDDDNLSTITQSISGNRGLPFKQRRAQLKGLPDEIIDARNKHYQEEYYKDIGRKQNIKNKKLDLIARQGIAQARALEMRERAEIENEEDVKKFIFR